MVFGFELPVGYRVDDLTDTTRVAPWRLTARGGGVTMQLRTSCADAPSSVHTWRLGFPSGFG